MERLNFLLPEFTRPSWVSDLAREVWEPRLQRITKAWLEIEWLSVVTGLRPCGVTMASPEEFVIRGGEWVRRGLSALPLEIQSLSNYCDSGAGMKTKERMPSVFRIVLGIPQAISDFQSALDAGDDQRICTLLGHPPCCSEFARKLIMEQGLEDTTWPMASATTAAAETARSLDITSPPETNILWRWIGLRAVPHLPCRFDCRHTVELGKKFMELGRDAGYLEEMDWLLEILSWPVEWSALHGIAEVKTPVVKVSTRTDATACKYVLRRKGEKYPLEGARGLRFPYQPARSSLVSSSRGFQRGLDHVINASDPSYINHKQTLSERK